MSSQAFLWVNVGLGLFLILIFLFGKKAVIAPSRLNLRRRSTPSAQSKSLSVTRAVEAASTVKDLNVIFVYNGHNFDAYEVFGLPAGSSLEQVQKEYQSAIRRQGQDVLFLEAAWSAIQASKKS